jgi:hypothetical protein
MKKSSSRLFGYLFFSIFLILGLWPFYFGKDLNPWLIGISLIFLLLTLTKSKILDFLNNYWIKLGNLLGKIISPIVLFIIFFGFITPLTILSKAFNKDLLNLKFNKSTTYWIKRDKKLESMNKQF